MAKVEIDEGSGFCFGVVTAINKAEEELAKGGTLYCLGDIVHNSREVERLKAMGLITINHEEFNHLHNAKVLLRAHGEPPETYDIARRNNIEIIDATCPVVLRLQRRLSKSTSRKTTATSKLSSMAKWTRRSTGSGRTNHRKGHRHRKAGRGKETGFQQRHPSLLPDHKVSGRISKHCEIHRGTYLTESHFRVL